MAEPAVYGDREVMLKDHAATTDLFKTLVDIRFKLLTFVPTVTTVAVGVISLDKQQKIFDEGATLVVGAAGVLISLAIVVYEIRNSQIHDRAAHRIKHLERLLGFTPSYAGETSRGMFQERGTGNPFLGLFIVQHDRALSIVYGVVMTLWTWVLLTGLGDFVGWFDGQNEWPRPWGKAAISIGVGLTVGAEITRHGGMGREKAITYTLANILPAGTTDSDVPGGEQLWRGLKRIDESVPPLPLYKVSVHKLLQELNMETFNAEGMVDLAIASGLLKVQQRLQPPWQRAGGKKENEKASKKRHDTWGEKRDERRNRALNMKKEQLPSPAQLCAAMAGGQEILEHFTQGQKIALNNNFTKEKAIALVRADLIQRYGAKAPWCSPEEVRLRWELLAAAAAEPKTVLSETSPATGQASSTPR